MEEIKPEAGEPQKTPQTEVPPVKKVEITKEELNELKHKAEVSSQNFERAKKAEDKLRVLETPNTINEVSSENDAWSDEGKLIVGKLSPLEDKINSLEERLALKDIQATYPMLREVSSEFDEFRKEYPRHKMENVAKLFLSEKGLLDSPRKGLEKPTGGPKNQKTPGTMTNEEVKHLRETNFRKYADMLKKGLIKIEN